MNSNYSAMTAKSKVWNLRTQALEKCFAKSVGLAKMTEDLVKSFEKFLQWRNRWRNQNKVLKDGKLVDTSN